MLKDMTFHKNDDLLSLSMDDNNSPSKKSNNTKQHVNIDSLTKRKSAEELSVVPPKKALKVMTADDFDVLSVSNENEEIVFQKNEDNMNVHLPIQEYTFTPLLVSDPEVWKHIFNYDDEATKEIN